MTLFTIHNKHTKNTWIASAEEALLFCSHIYGMPDDYVVYDTNGQQYIAIELLSFIYAERKKQKAKNV